MTRLGTPIARATGTQAENGGTLLALRAGTTTDPRAYTEHGLTLGARSKAGGEGSTEADARQRTDHPARP